MSQQRQASYSVADPILEVRDGSVTFDMSRGVSRVLDNVDIEIGREEILGVVGESGSGKSMFASTLLDSVDEPGRTSGEVIYHPEDGDPVDILGFTTQELKRVRWEEISFVVQGAQSGFNPTMTVGDHFEETLISHDADLDDGMKRATQLLRDVYLEPVNVLDSYPHQLSGGQKQRALIALSLILEPEILVLDEPTASLDLLMQRSILSLLAELQEQYSLTMLFITHDLPLVTDLADRLAVMYAFEFVEVAPTEAILESAAHPYTRALLNSVPDMTSPVDGMQPIEGSSPDPVNVPSGCSYHPRCPVADETCKNTDPPLEPVDREHLAACFYPDEAREAITLPHLEKTTSTDAERQKPGARRTERDTVVSVKDVTVRFEQSKLMGLAGTTVTTAVDGVTLEIGENDVVALVGESGCGKTTLGKTAIGLQRPNEGRVTYRGHDIWEARDRSRFRSWFRDDGEEMTHGEIRQSLQIIHQDPGSSLNPNYTIGSELKDALKYYHSDLSEEDRRARILGLLEHAGMSPAEDYINRYPHQLSGGEKQRAVLIRALLMNPDLILADEAISALDVSLRIEMMDLMLDLQDMFETSYLFISHDLSNARYIAKKADGRIGIMYLGEIVEMGTVDQILNDPQHPYTKVLLWSTPDITVGAVEEPPLREIDVPDPSDPPNGCRFHTRCPEAREVCSETAPPTIEIEEGHRAACFRGEADHEYWESRPLGAPDQETSSDPVVDDG